MADKIQITSADGYPLAATLYQPTVSNQCAVLIYGAMAVRQIYYAQYAFYLAKQGFIVLNYDYRGIGDSSPQTLRGLEAGLLARADEDQNTMHRWLADQFPHYRRLVVGLSFGGQIVGLTPTYPEVAGWLVVGPQSGYWRLWD